MVGGGSSSVGGTGLILAAAVVLGAGLGAGLVSPGPADAFDTPRRSSSTSPAEPTSTISPVAHSPAPAPSPEPVTTAVPPSPADEPQPARPPSETAKPTSTLKLTPLPEPTPTVRPPLSVSPVPRPAFPNQRPDTGSDDRGLLPNLGGLL